MAFLSFLQIALALCLLYVSKRLFLDRKAASLPPPPGPKKLPVLGNITDLPVAGTPEYKHWLKHKDQYGPISSISALGLTMVIVHDKGMALDLLEKRGSTNSGRPPMKFAMDM